VTERSDSGEAHHDRWIAVVLTALEARNLTPLLDEVCCRRGVVRQDLCGRARTLSVSRARQELWWLIRNQPDRHYSFPEIAALFLRDHTTVLQGIRAHQRRAAP
jgi:chromosomal replication initiation ATPase DnaA